MSPIEIAMNKQRKKVILGFGVVFGGLWLLLVIYLLTGNKQTIPSVPAAQVTVHAPSPVAIGSTPAATFRSSRRVAPLIHHSAATPSWSYVQSAPKATMGSTSMRIHQTSSATLQSIGGAGGSGGGIYTTSGGGNSGKGIRYTAVAYTGAIYIPTKHNSVSEVGASTANEVTTTSSVRAGVQRRAKMDDGLPGYNEDPVPDEVETPVGDVAWGWMILLAAGYASMRGVRRVRQEEK